MTARKIRPTVRFGTNQYTLIQKKLKERGVSFQAYVNELICRDLGVPMQEFETLADESQITLFDIAGDELAKQDDDVTE